MMKHLLHRFVALFVIGVLVPPEASGADIRKLPEETRSDCSYELIGEIGQGDYDALISHNRDFEAYFDGESTASLVFCLDSPGGSVTEGIKIARYFQEQGIGTRLAGYNQFFVQISVLVRTWEISLAWAHAL